MGGTLRSHSMSNSCNWFLNRRSIGQWLVVLNPRRPLRTMKCHLRPHASEQPQHASAALRAHAHSKLMLHPHQQHTLDGNFAQCTNVCLFITNESNNCLG